MTSNPDAKGTIKSFVRRTGRMTPAQKNALEHYWPIHGIGFDRSKSPLEAVASGFEALKLEIGFGNGDALIQMAGNDRTSLYFGIEVHEPGVGRCLNNITIKDLNNVKIFSHDAIEVMQYMLPVGAFECIFLFFPDPWHKKRHHKRRIVNPLFRNLCSQLLKPRGLLHMATDWQDYAEHMALELLGDDRFVSCGDKDGFSERPEYRPLTKFEQRGIRLGHGVWDLIFQKR